MRVRKKKHGAERLAACAEILCERPTEPIPGGERPLWLEIGCGKGGFACGMAAAHPEVSFYAMEKVSDVLVLAAERAMAMGDERPAGLRFLRADAKDLPEWFAPGSLSGIFLNFSDPWPKAGHAKRRLTHRTFLSSYFALLADGGFLALKTDNESLFAFTLEELAAVGRLPLWQTDDLHASRYAEGNILTEYEKNFIAQGMPIHALRVIK